MDLKPANFLMVGGRLKLIDFGIAAKINSDATSIVKESQAGTFNYISPEALTDTSDESSSQHPKFKVMREWFWMGRCSIDLYRNILLDLHKIGRLVIGMYFVFADLQEDSLRTHQTNSDEDGSHHESQDRH